MSVVLITGSNGGFGSAAALAFARAGDIVFATMRNPAKGQALLEAARRESLELRIEALDITQPQSVETIVERIVARAGSLDVLVNNAGILHVGAFEDLPTEKFREVLEVNLIGPMLLTRAVLPQMRRQKSGYVINISSLSGIAGLPGDVAYTASKFALEGATEALRHEVDRFGIRVALVEAGLYATNIFSANYDGDRVLPADYPAASPYRPLIERRMRALRERLADALDPRVVGELLVRISRSDGSQLRWPADQVATTVLSKMLAQDDATRDAFLRSVSGTDWWSEGRDG